MMKLNNRKHVQPERNDQFTQDEFNRNGMVNIAKWNKNSKKTETENQWQNVKRHYKLVRWFATWFPTRLLF